MTDPVMHKQGHTQNEPIERTTDPSHRCLDCNSADDISKLHNAVGGCWPSKQIRLALRTHKSRTACLERRSLDTVLVSCTCRHGPDGETGTAPDGYCAEINHVVDWIR